LFTEKYFTNKKGYVGHYQEVIKLMRPENILKKGFAIVSQKGKILKDASSIEPGSEINISMDQFEIQTKVLSKKQKDE
jgi:exodeoxyribonuclease VII large subunit